MVVDWTPQMIFAGVTALCAATGAVLVPITALLLNYRGFTAIDNRFASVDSRFASIDSRFASIENRFASLERSIDARFDRIESHLEMMQTDLKNFYHVQSEHATRLALLEKNTG